MSIKNNIIHNIIKFFDFIINKFIFLCKKIFAKKTLILVSNNKIRNLEINPALQILIVVFTIFTVNIFYKSTIYNEIISTKISEIKKLEQTNQRFHNELLVINNNLEKINNYFMTIADYEQDLDDKKQASLHDQELDKILADLNLEENYKKTAIEIANANIILDNIKLSAKKRSLILESEINKTGILVTENRISRNKNSYENEFVALSLNTEEELSKQGGPFETIPTSQEQQAIDASINLGTVDIND